MGTKVYPQLPVQGRVGMDGGGRPAQESRVLETAGCQGQGARREGAVVRQAGAPNTNSRPRPVSHSHGRLALCVGGQPLQVHPSEALNTPLFGKRALR